jgi:non-ribosomal peptide synthetase component F
LPVPHSHTLCAPAARQPCPSTETRSCVSGSELCVSVRHRLVRVPHRAAVLHVRALVQSLALRPTDRVVLLAPCSFDPSVIEVFGALAAGCTLSVSARAHPNSERCCIHSPAWRQVVPLSVLRSATRCATALHRARPTAMMCTPALLRHAAAGAAGVLPVPPSVRMLVLGGEAFPSRREIVSWTVRRAGGTAVICCSLNTRTGNRAVTPESSCSTSTESPRCRLYVLSSRVRILGDADAAVGCSGLLCTASPIPTQIAFH